MPGGAVTYRCWWCSIRALGPDACLPPPPSGFQLSLLSAGMDLHPPGIRLRVQSVRPVSLDDHALGLVSTLYAFVFNVPDFIQMDLDVEKRSLGGKYRCNAFQEHSLICLVLTGYDRRRRLLGGSTLTQSGRGRTYGMKSSMCRTVSVMLVLTLWLSDEEMHLDLLISFVCVSRCGGVEHHFHLSHRGLALEYSIHSVVYASSEPLHLWTSVAVVFSR